MLSFLSSCKQESVSFSHLVFAVRVPLLDRPAQTVLRSDPVASASSVNSPQTTLSHVVAVHESLSARTASVALLEVASVQLADARVLTRFRLLCLAAAREAARLCLQVVELVDVARQAVTQSALILKADFFASYIHVCMYIHA